jgi:hypothetical protein
MAHYGLSVLYFNGGMFTDEMSSAIQDSLYVGNTVIINGLMAGVQTALELQLRGWQLMNVTTKPSPSGRGTLLQVVQGNSLGLTGNKRKRMNEKRSCFFFFDLSLSLFPLFKNSKL